MTPRPITVRWRGQGVRVRHDDPRLGPYSKPIKVLGPAMSLASDAEGVRLAIASTLGSRYEARVPDDVSEVRLRRVVT
jgi:hypothetical protein